MNRRKVRFHSLDEVVDDLQRLLASGYQQAGNWNLSQVCGHLEQWMTFAMDGFPKRPFPINVMLWAMKVTVAKRQLRQILDQGFKPGGPTMPQTVLKSDDVDDTAAVESLRRTIERFKAYAGPIHPSPLFGELDRETALRLQLRHCEHHLSFLSFGDSPET